ncbi:MAG: hypothetical protein QNJ53_30455 [Pleurocapsa sp. MO_192.B19]|nr:hypothetical protein [Pleurocapsa sp. MO_192.B19]
MNLSSSVASRLQPRHRQEIAVKVLTKQEPITQIANQEQVSRKFIYQQKAIASGGGLRPISSAGARSAIAIEALNQALEKSERENEVLYYLPITQQWICQLILALILICQVASLEFRVQSSEFRKASLYPNSEF